MTRSAVLPVTLMMVLPLAQMALAQTDMQQMSPETLTVTGQGEAEAPPDRAVVRMGVTAQDAQAAAAQKAVSQVMQQVIEKVQATGIAKEAIRTTGLSLSPVYQHPKPDHEPTEPRLVGYRASNNIEVRIDELRRIGDVIDAAVAAGANQVQSIDFPLKNDTAAQQLALARAAKNARAKADALAEAMGAQLGLVVSAAEAGATLPPPQLHALAGRARLPEASAATPVQPGELQIRATVTIQYRIDRKKEPPR